MNAAFRKKLRSGERLLGTIVSLDSPEVVEIIRIIGFDWVFIDGEHNPLEALSTQRLVQAAGPEMACLVRPPRGDEVFIKKALDIGAAGIIVPMVNTAEDAERVVRFSKYPPLGARGVGLARAHGYGLRFQEYVEGANEGVSVVIQAEHIQAVENMEEIVQVKGIDAVLIGPYDLSASMGRLGEVSHPEVVEAINRVAEVCQRGDIALGIFGANAEALRPYMERGFTLIAAGADTMLLGDAARGLLERLK
jgi:2-keto-3-deoxy-L-rhamnonate aldolase RhmA